MSGRPWRIPEQEHQEQQQPQQQPTVPPPISLPFFPAQQYSTSYHSAGMPTCLQSSSIYSAIDPTFSAGYYHYTPAGYGTATAFTFPPPEHLQQPHPSFSGLIGDTTPIRPHAFQRSRLHQIGRTFSSPEMPTPPSTVMTSTLGVPSSMAYFPPPNGQLSHSLPAVESSIATAHSSLMESYHASLSGFFLQQQRIASPTTSHSGSHSPSINVSMASHTLPMPSPFGDTSFLFHPPPTSPSAFAALSQASSSHVHQIAGPVQQQQQMTCAVCGDVASCLHYGVRTCEGCKGFFKRTVQKNAKYICLGNRDCVIDKRRRNRCQYCRFHKCLNVGMVKQVVRTDSLKGRRGRLPSKSKYPIASEEAGPSTSSSGYPVSQSLTKALVNAYTADSTGQSLSTIRLGSIDRFVDSLRVGVQAVHQFMERVPGWSSIANQDKIQLLKRYTVHALSLRWAYRSASVASEGKIITDDNFVYTMNECAADWRTWFQSILSLSDYIHSTLELDITAFSCLFPLCFVFYDYQLTRAQDVDKLKNNIINCLKEHCAYSEARNKPQYFSNSLTILNDLNSIAQYAKQAYRCYFGDTAALADRPTTSSVAPLSLTFLDECFLN